MLINLREKLISIQIIQLEIMKIYTLGSDSEILVKIKMRNCTILVLYLHSTMVNGLHYGLNIIELNEFRRFSSLNYLTKRL